MDFTLIYLRTIVGFRWDGIQDQDSCRLQALSMNITKWQVEMQEGLAEGTDYVILLSKVTK